MPFKIKIIK